MLIDVGRELKQGMEVTGDIRFFITAEEGSDPLFSTQKRHHFTPNTLAQHYSALDAALRDRFQLSTEPTKSEIQPRHSDIPTNKTKSLLSRFANQLL